MLTFFSFIFVLSVLVIAHEFGHFIIARRTGVRVERFSIGFGPEVFGINRGGTRYVLSLIPLGGYVKLAGEMPEERLTGEVWEFLSRRVGERARIILAGPVLNYILAFLIFYLIFLVGNPTLTSDVGKVLLGYPAETSGIKEGDRILSINGKDVKYWEEITRIVHKANQKPLSLILSRGGEKVSVLVTPKREEIKTLFGRKVAISLIGIEHSQNVEKVRYNPILALYMAGNRLIGLTYITLGVIFSILTKTLPVKDSLAGPLAMYFITREAVRLGPVYLLQLLAVLSASLAIINLLPIPVLDGGHLLFLGIEKLIGKPLHPKLQENITQIGMLFLILLMTFVFYNDLLRIGFFDRVAEFIVGK